MFSAWFNFGSRRLITELSVEVDFGFLDLGLAVKVMASIVLLLTEALGYRPVVLVANDLFDVCAVDS